MKPVLYVALRGVYGMADLPDLNADHLICVTSEIKVLDSIIAVGTTAAGESARCLTDQIIARFPDLGTSRKALAKANLAHDAYCVIIERAEEELRNLQATQRLAVKTAISDFTLP